MKKLIALIPLCSLLIWQACKSDGNKPLNPNGDSELAVLMRQLYDDGQRVKSQIEKGEAVDIQVDYEKILTAKATEPEKMQGPDYLPFAQGYVAAMNALKASTPADVKDKYAAMVAACKNCHEHSCPGPLVRIKKLNL